MNNVVQPRVKVGDLPDDELVKLRVQLRDERLRLKAEYEEAKDIIERKESKIEGILLVRFKASGHDSVRTPYGTAYKSKKVTISVADKESFMQFVKENDSYDMLEGRCSKASIEQYKEATGDLPPGINYREEIVVNVRRSA